MATKHLIIDDLGERALLLPQKPGAALVANDRLKLCFSLLQAAESHADHPQEPLPDLASEQRLAGLDGDVALGILESRRESDGALYIPGAAHLRDWVLADLSAMQEPLRLAGVAEAEGFAARLRKRLREFLPKDDV